MNNHPEREEQFPKKRAPRLVPTVDGIWDPSNDSDNVNDEECGRWYEKSSPFEQVELGKISVLVWGLGSDSEVGINTCEYFEQTLHDCE